MTLQEQLADLTTKEANILLEISGAKKHLDSVRKQKDRIEKELARRKKWEEERK